MLELLAANAEHDYELRSRDALCTAYVVWVIDDTGINISCMTHSTSQSTLINIQLQSHNFIAYEYHGDAPTVIGIPVYHLRGVARDIKGKLDLCIYIETTDPTNMCFDIGTKGGIIRKVPFIHEVQWADYVIDITQFKIYHVFSSPEFYIICKHVTKTESKLSIQSHPDRVVITSRSLLDASVHHTSYLRSNRRLVTGMTGVDMDTVYPSRGLDVDPLSSLMRLGKMSTIIRMHLSDHCVRLECTVGSLGHASVCIHSG